MVFWVSVLAGAVCIVFAMKKGFYSVWAIFINILISIFLGIMLTPSIISLISGSVISRYHYSACIIIISALVFATLQTVANNFFTGAAEVSFPKVFDKIGSGVLGFFSGYIVCSFAFFVVCIMPFWKEPVFKGIVKQDDLVLTASKFVVMTCDFVSSTSLQNYNNGQRAVDLIVKGWHDPNEVSQIYITY